MENFHLYCTCSGSSVDISTAVRNFCMWTMCTWKLTHSLVDLLEENHCLGFHIHFHLSFVNVFLIYQSFSATKKFKWGMKGVKFGGLKSALWGNEKVQFRGLKRYKSEGAEKCWDEMNYNQWRWEEVSRMQDERWTISEDRATQLMEAGGWVSQYSTYPPCLIR